MVKAEFSTWMKFAISVLIILAVGVGWGVGYKALADNVGNNTSETNINASDIKVHAEENAEHEAAMTERIHQMELAHQDIKNVAVRSAEAMISIDAKLGAIQAEQARQATIQAVNSEKLKTLTKD